MSYQNTAKRAFDIAGSLVGIAVTAAPAIGISFALAVTHKKNPLFLQERVGFNKKPFKIYKFRTLIDVNKGSAEPISIEERATKIGSWLRKTKLDEIPQFLNVLKGDMSLVGPRPDIDPLYTYGNSLALDKKRHFVKPGMTGLTQLYNLKTGSNKHKLKLDHDYVDNHTLTGDIKICVATLLNIAGKKGQNLSQKLGLESHLTLKT